MKSMIIQVVTVSRLECNHCLFRCARKWSREFPVTNWLNWPFPGDWRTTLLTRIPWEPKSLKSCVSISQNLKGIKQIVHPSMLELKPALGSMTHKKRPHTAPSCPHTSKDFCLRSVRPFGVIHVDCQFHLSTACPFRSAASILTFLFHISLFWSSFFSFSELLKIKGFASPCKTHSHGPQARSSSIETCVRIRGTCSKLDLLHAKQWRSSMRLTSERDLSMHVIW